MAPGRLQRLMNFYPPLLGAGIRVRHISSDWTLARVELRLGMVNRNQHGSAFGGSIGAMSDAFFALLLMNQLGSDYHVWDKQAHIDYVSPGVGTVFGTFAVPRQVAEQIRTRAQDGQKVLHWFETDLTLRDGTVVAHVRRQVYIRRKRQRTDLEQAAAGR